VSRRVRCRLRGACFSTRPSLSPYARSQDSSPFVAGVRAGARAGGITSPLRACAGCARGRTNDARLVGGRACRRDGRSAPIARKLPISPCGRSPNSPTLLGD
jgi:hypothetical protein